MTRKRTRNYSLSVVARCFTILITLAAMAVAQPALVHFASPVPYPLDVGGTNSMVMGDVNGDGKPDVVVVSDGGVSVLLGNGDGTFQPPTSYSTGGWSVAIGDFNGDGKLDLVVADPVDGEVYVRLGNGDGTFQAAQTVSNYPFMTLVPVSVAVADVNGDGKPDLVVAGWTTSYAGVVSVLLGNGDGTFQPAVTYDAGGTHAWLVAVADVNGDGHPDLIVPDSYKVIEGYGVVGVLLGNGDGTFQPVMTYNTAGYYAYSVAVADVNGDSKPDLIVGNAVGGMGVLLGNGDGTFRTLGNYFLAGDHETSVAIGDVNGDGKPDVVVANATVPPALHVLLGNGDGTFQTPVKYSPGGWHPNSVAIVDVNADGRPDLLVANNCTARDNCSVGNVSVLLNNFTAKTTTAITSSLNPSFLNQSVTFTATVTSTPPVPGGQLMTFYDGTTALASVALVGGAAEYSTSALSAKTHYIQAKYSGDTWHKPSAGSASQQVLKYPSTTILSSSLNLSNYGDAVTLTATVTSAGSAPTGTVTFKNGAMILGGKTLDASGVATLTTTKIPVGADPLTATYNGDTSNGKSVSAAITQTISQASISMVLTSTPNPSSFGRSVKFTATLTSNGGLPSGQSVTFSYNNATLGTAIVNGRGVATFSTTTLPQGSDVATAAYAGNVDYSSASATVTQVVN